MRTTTFIYIFIWIVKLTIFDINNEVGTTNLVFGQGNLSLIYSTVKATWPPSSIYYLIIKNIIMNL